MLRQAVIEAVRGGDLASLRDLCEYHGANPAGNQNEPLRLAAKWGHLCIVQWLCELPLRFGVCPAALDNLALRWAARHGRLNTLRYLCELPPERGVDPAADRNGAIKRAVQTGRVDVARYLWSLPYNRGVRDPDFDYHWALRWAVNYEQFPLVAFLCEMLHVDVESALAKFPGYWFFNHKAKIQAAGVFVRQTRRWTRARAAWIAACVMK